MILGAENNGKPLDGRPPRSLAGERVLAAPIQEPHPALGLRPRFPALRVPFTPMVRGPDKILHWCLE